MEKLELKHLAGYLPYGFKVLSRETIFEMDIYSNMKGSGIEKREIQSVISNQMKPILRPLSDLTKEIDVNGEKFIPIDVLCSIETSEEEDFKLYGKIPEIWEFMIKTKPRYWDYWQVEKLYEWHFDIHGLIEKGLAIDINTLRK